MRLRKYNIEIIAKGDMPLYMVRRILEDACNKGDSARCTIVYPNDGIKDIDGEVSLFIEEINNGEHNE